MIKEYIDKLRSYQDLIQLIKYGMIGVLGLIVDFGVYSIFTFEFGINKEVANVISSSCGLINNFFWNSFANFKVRDHLWRRFIEYYLVGQITTVMTTISIFIFVTLLKEDSLVVKMISTIVATLIQFFVNKIVTFKK